MLLARDGETADEILTVSAISDWWSGVLRRDRAKRTLVARPRQARPVPVGGLIAGGIIGSLALLQASFVFWTHLVPDPWGIVPVLGAVALVPWLVRHVLDGDSRYRRRVRRDARRRLTAVRQRIRALYTAEDEVTLDALVAQSGDRHALTERERLSRTTLLAFRRFEELTSRPRSAQSTDQHARDVDALAVQVEAVERRSRSFATAAR